MRWIADGAPWDGRIVCTYVGLLEDKGRSIDCEVKCVFGDVVGNKNWKVNKAKISCR